MSVEVSNTVEVIEVAANVYEINVGAGANTYELTVVSPTYEIDVAGTGTTDVTSVETTTYEINVGNVGPQGPPGPTTPTGCTFLLARTAPIEVSTNATNALIVPSDYTITKAVAYAQSPPVGAALVFDVKRNGVSLWATTPSNRLRIASGANLGQVTSFDTSALSSGDILTIDVVQVGSSFAGQSVTVEIIIN